MITIETFLAILGITASIFGMAWIIKYQYVNKIFIFEKEGVQDE